MLWANNHPCTNPVPCDGVRGTRDYPRGSECPPPLTDRGASPDGRGTPGRHGVGSSTKMSTSCASSVSIARAPAPPEAPAGTPPLASHP